jgi:elongation factor Ts
MSTPITAQMVNDLRGQTGAGLLDCKKALTESNGNVEEAITILRKKGAASAAKKADRMTKEGLVESYIHVGGKVGVLIEVNCETDFVARTEEFRQLAREVAMHVAATSPLAVSVDQLPAEVVERERRIYTEQVAQEGKPEAIRAKIVEGKLKKFYAEAVLLEQPFVKDDSRTVGDVVKALSGKTGENVVVRRFVRYQLGEDV